jgi:hypothetical protein
MEISTPIPDQRLQQFSEEHLYYEVSMLYGVTDLLVRGTPSHFIHNALLESFVIHASNVLDFFYRPQVKEDDVKALHYVKDIKQWRTKLPVQSDEFKEFQTKRNKWVMHMSYNRLDVGPQDRRWGAPKLAKQIKKLVDLFLDNADPARLHPRMQQLHSRQAKNTAGRSDA